MTSAHAVAARATETAILPQRDPMPYDMSMMFYAGTSNTMGAGWGGAREAFHLGVPVRDDFGVWRWSTWPLDTRQIETSSARARATVAFAGQQHRIA